MKRFVSLVTITLIILLTAISCQPATPTEVTPNSPTTVPPTTQPTIPATETASPPKRSVVLISFDGSRTDFVYGMMDDGTLPTFASFKEQACAAATANNADDNPDNDGTGGLVLYAGASNVASFVFANGGDMRNAAGDGYDITDQTVVDTANFMKELWDEKCAYPTESYPNPEFATRKALFTMSSTAGLPYQIAAFEAEDAIKDE